MKQNNRQWDFDKLVVSIRQANEELTAQAGRAVNVSLTLRNWLIGYYITEYEQNGLDRAEYGARLLESLSDQLTEGGMEGVASRSLRQYRQFYLTYPEICKKPYLKIDHQPFPYWSSFRNSLSAISLN